MSKAPLIRKIISSLIFLNMVKRYKTRSSLMKIKAAQVYVAGVQKVRIFFLGILFVMFSFVLLGSGLFLIHTALFTYSQWSFQVKFIAALVLGVIEFAGAIGILSYLSREDVWAKFTGIPKVLDSVVRSRKSDSTQ